METRPEGPGGLVPYSVLCVYLAAPATKSTPGLLDIAAASISSPAVSCLTGTWWVFKKDQLHMSRASDSAHALSLTKSCLLMLVGPVSWSCKISGQLSPCPEVITAGPHGHSDPWHNLCDPIKGVII